MKSYVPTLTAALTIAALGAHAHGVESAVELALTRYGSAGSFSTMVVMQTTGGEGMHEGASSVSYLEFARPGTLSIVSESMVLESGADGFVAQSLTTTESTERPAPARLSAIGETDPAIAARLAPYPVLDLLSNNRAAFATAEHAHEMRNGRAVLRVRLPAQTPTEVVIDEKTGEIVSSRVALDARGSRWCEATYTEQKITKAE